MARLRYERMSALSDRINIVWGNDPPLRYLPRAFEPDRTIPGGWGVFDKVGNRFLTDLELLALSLETLATETNHH